MSAPVDYEVEYNNRARVPEHPALIAGWASDAAAYRERHAPRAVRYGAGARNVIDFFPGSGDGPIVVFIHGGYWQALDNSFFSHLAGGLNAHGIGVAIPGYDLCPDVSVDQHHRGDAGGLPRTGTAGTVPRRQRPFRRRASCRLHAGDRLAGPDASLPRDLVTSAYSISGLFDLGPLVETSINRALHLDAAAARAASPLFWNPPAGKSLDAVVGENESAEYFRQSRTVARSGAPPASPPVSAWFPAPTILPRSRRSPIRARRWCRA